MSNSLVHWRAVIKTACLLGSSLVVLSARSLPAQSLTVGGLTIMVVDERGTPVQEATVTLERGGAVVRSLTATRGGLVAISVLPPGRYAVLAEQFGYQPVRMRDVDVVGGGMTRITIKVTRRPPPITTVEEQASNATMSGASRGRSVTRRVMRRDSHYRLGRPPPSSKPGSPSPVASMDQRRTQQRQFHQRKTVPWNQRLLNSGWVRTRHHLHWKLHAGSQRGLPLLSEPGWPPTVLKLKKWDSHRFSAPARITRRISSRLRMPPPTEKGMNIV